MNEKVDFYEPLFPIRNQILTKVHAAVTNEYRIEQFFYLNINSFSSYLGDLCFTT